MTDVKSDKKYDLMTSSPIAPLFFKMAVPTVISMLVSSLYNMVDTFYVGMLKNTSATGAVGVVFALMATIQAFGFFFGHGSGNYISRMLGGKNAGDAETMASCGFFLSLLIGALITVFGLIFIDPLATLLGSTGTIKPYAIDYMRYILIGAPYMCASLVLNNQLRFQGNTVYAMAGIVSGALLNTALDPLFMFRSEKLGIGFNMGISGAALATMISQLVGFIILLFGVFRSGSVRIRLSEFSLETRFLREIVKGGSPSLFRQELACAATIILNYVAKGIGNDPLIAAFSIISRLTMFANAAMLGLGQGYQPICAFNYGAKKYSRVRKAFVFCAQCSFISLVVVSAAGFIFSPQIIALFRDDPEVVKYGSFAFRLLCLVYPLNTWIVLTNMTLQAVGTGAKATFLASARQGLFFIPAVLILPHIIGVTGVQIAQPAADVLTFAVSLPFGIAFLKKINVPDGEDIKQ